MKSLQTIFIGSSCNDFTMHFEEVSTMTNHQKIVLSELMNHSDWEKYCDLAALDYSSVCEAFKFF